MKNMMKKVIAIILCLSVFGTSEASACIGVGGGSAFDTLKRFVSVFTGSRNEKSNMEITIEQDEIFKAKKYFKSSHASTIVKMPDGNLMSAFFAGTAEGNADVRIWYSIYDGESWS